MNKQSDNKNTSYPALYRIIWRWHFYAGLFCIPFILTLAISGTIYLFKPQIDSFVDRPFHNLPITDVRSTPNQQITAAINSLPGSSFISYQLPRTNSEAVVISVNDSSKPTLVYVNPYTLEILKTIGVNDQFIRVVRTFHGELLAGNFGSIIIELAGCWAIVLIVSGLFLWWPRTSNGLAGVIYPRLRLKGRLFWRDLHSVLGIWVSIFTLFLLISGLPWALVWGNAFKEIRQLAAAQNISSQQNNLDEHAMHQGTVDQGTAIGQGTMDRIPPRPLQDWTVSRNEEIALLSQSEAVSVNLSPQLLESARKLNFAPPVELSVVRDNNDLWKVSSQHQNRMLRSNAWIDNKTLATQQIEHFGDRVTLDKVIGIGISAHEGQLFGWFNQLLGVFITFSLTLISISGFIMWRQRKPEKVLGAPPALKNARAGKVVTFTLIALCVFLPLLLISVVALFLIEWLIVRHLPSTSQWLGFTTS